VKTEDKLQQMIDKADVIEYSVNNMPGEIHRGFPVGSIEVTQRELEFGNFIQIIIIPIAYATPFFRVVKHELVYSSMRRRKNVWHGQLAFQNGHEVDVKFEFLKTMPIVSN
jgi:hypothetical protein